MTEVAEDEEGIIYDTTEWTITAVVVDHDNQLEIDELIYSDGEEEAEQPVFDNEYIPEPTEYQPKVTKTIIGEPTVVDKTFTFTLTTEMTDVPGYALPETTEIQVTVPEGKTGEAIEGIFDAISFTMAGTYTFQIQETKEDLAGITYDETVWTLTVEVEDKDGTLEIVKTLYEAEEKDASEELAAFENPYAPTPAFVIVEAEKLLTGQTPVKEETFTFTLKTIDLVEDGSFVGDLAIAKGDQWTREIVGAGTVTFDEIKYLKAGTYTYELTEVKGNATGWTYDPIVWTITVEVVDKDGELSSTVTKKGSSDQTAITFINEYVPNPVEYVPMVEKTVIGVPTVTDKTFTFTLTASEENPEGASLNGDSELTAQITVPAGATGEGITAEFGAIEFTIPGTYTFTVKEEAGDEAGITYDETVWTLTVEVIDAEGDLKVTKSVYEADGKEASDQFAAFENPYEPAPAIAVLNIEKIITGQKPEEVPTFEFTMTAVDLVEGASFAKDAEEAIVSGDTWTVSIPGAGEASFGEICYAKTGTYTYELTEVTGDAKGWIYSTSKWLATVTVTDKDGVLEAKVEYELEGKVRNDKAPFTNEYKPDIPPKTGDQTHLLLYFLAMLGSLSVALFMFLLYRRTRRSER